MIEYPKSIHPVAFEIFGHPVRWYGLMYVLGFIAGRQILRHLSRRGWLRMNPELIDDYLIALFIGMLLASRLTFMLVYYDPAPGETMEWYTPFQIWKGGLAFHGGAVGMFLATWYFAWRHKLRFFNLLDSLVLAAPIGLFLGRIGNFLNIELYGRVTDVAWAMQFPVRDFDGNLLGYTAPRHPSQLYEAFGEGLLGLVFIWTMKRYVVRYQGELMGWGLVWYAVARTAAEFFREPDDQMGYYGIFTMGQILSAIMLMVGVFLVVWAYRRKAPVYRPVLVETEAAEIPEGERGRVK